ncbi:pyridoxal phosphate homeostasis protein [Phlebotomus argentipes]|uniref:pyridoxal phosphate homeostasis protein n=1 Tax=Phlebotomus argentipes TaxID=94469 RepID=UPI002892E5F9|nr:pyridoxal phosphate homeostasis protein [Phlebotomus argentipes]
MYRRIMSEVDIKQNLKLVVERIEEAFKKRPPALQTEKPFLVAVAKTKPADVIAEAYAAGQKHFGENYVQELSEKGLSVQILDKCKEIKWHFIGHLQSNKVNKVLAVPGLYMIETVDSENLATVINKAWEKVQKEDKERLRVLVQVNTSGEEAKSGVQPKDAASLYKFIKEKCPNLSVEGVMTIGKYVEDYTGGPNEDFIALMQCHENIVKEFNLNPRDVHVSMGMSHDFEDAVIAGASIVRVGTSIFGARTPKPQAK